jgi:DNA topoisomerase-1
VSRAEAEAYEHAPGLRYVSGAAPGIMRRRAGGGFVYLDPGGRRITDPEELERIRGLVIPPAWTDVWICRDHRGHLQATGRDARGRKQYRYHRRWRAHRDQNKFDRMAAFGTALPVIRRRVDRDLSRRGVTRDRALASIVLLLDRTLIRVGNEEYARANRSFGLSTLRDDHVEVDGSRLRFCFRGKGGKEHEVELRDPRLARLVQRMQDLPGHHLFQFVDDEGVAHEIDSEDVNVYLREIGGDGFSAKDFRTWGATAHVTEQLLDAGPASDRADAESNVVAAVRSAAERLGNTPAIVRNSYLHPVIPMAYAEGRLGELWDGAREGVRRRPKQLSPEEAVLLQVLATEEKRSRAA